MLRYAVLALCCLSVKATSASFSYTGQLATPESFFEQAFTLPSATSIQIRTYGFGGGTNAAGSVIPSGGFDPLIALFSGTVSPNIVTDSLGNAVASADTLTSFTPNCPPAGFVTIGSGSGSSVCGDDFVSVANLPAGTYTLLLSDAGYIPLAVDPGPPASTALADGFSDLTGGVFQACNFTASGTTCITPTSNYAVDLIENSSTPDAGVPEPTTFGILTAGLFILLIVRRRYKQPRQKK